MYKGYNWSSRLCASVIIVITGFNFFLDLPEWLKALSFGVIILCATFLIWSPEYKIAKEQLRKRR